MIEIPAEFHKFVEANRNADVARLRLKYHATDSAEWIQMAISHIECLKKAGLKFGPYQPELMLNPLSVEQSTSAEVASLHAGIAKELIGDKLVRVVDMTCGMGIDLMAIVRHLNAEAIGFEMNPIVAEASKWNYRDDKCIEIRCADSVEWLSEYDGPKIDLLFIDPARRSESGGRVYALSDCTPDVTALLPHFRTKCRYVMAKLSPMLDVSATLSALPETKEIFIIGNKNECVELFIVMDFSKNQASDFTPSITIISEAGLSERFTFTRGEELSATASYGVPSPGMWLFEPSPAAMKGAPFNLLCSRHGLAALHPNTHLYFAEEPVGKLPGRWYEIENLFPLSSSTLKGIGKSLGCADVAVRNFPMKAEELAKRMKLKSGGSHRMIGATSSGNPSDSKILLLLKK